jgi:hydrogenase/urease accessory protein HupE
MPLLRLDSREQLAKRNETGRWTSSMPKARAKERTMKKISIAAAAFLAMATTAQADPGAHHMPFVQTLFHLLTEPDHLAMIAGAAALAIFLYAKSRKQA